MRYNTNLSPPIQSCSFKFWSCSCIASDFDKGLRGGHKHKFMDGPINPKYGTVSQVLLQLAVDPRLLFFRFLLFLRHRAPPRECRPLIGMAYGVFLHDVTAAILVPQNNETAAMLVSQTSPVGVELFPYANAFFCSNKFA